MRKICIWSLVLVFCALLSGCGSNLERSAEPLVTQIIQEQFGGTAECVGITLGNEFSTDRYHATAILDNGNELDIVIHDMGATLEVQIPSQ
jgi:uncharacterized protein YceK